MATLMKVRLRLTCSLSTRVRVSSAIVFAFVIAGCGTAAPRPTSTAPARSSSGARRAITRSATTTVPSGTPDGTLASTGPAGGPVPSRTRATSISFVSPATGFVLGTAPCAHKPCSVILRTRDRGVSWVGLAAPRESVSTVIGTGLWGLRFADPRRGFAYGDGLWETSDGAARWKRATPPAAIIIDLEAVRDRELVALAGSCPAIGNGCRNSHESLYHRPLSGGAWSRAISLGMLDASASIAVHGSDVWVLAGTRLWLSSDGGQSFRTISQPCTNRGATPGATSVTDDWDHAYLLCVGEPGAGSALKYVYRRDGSVWRLVGKPPTGGLGGIISAGSDHAIIVASSSGASWLYRSTNAGRTWSTALALDSGGAPWGDLGFTTATDGVVIEGPAAVGRGESSVAFGRVLLTDDGGRTWTVSRF